MILAIQETKRNQAGVEEWYFEGEELKGWKFVGTSKSSKVGGVGFILGPGVVVEEVLELDEKLWNRIIGIKLKLHGLNMKIINGYAPHEGYATSTKLKFYSDLKKCRVKIDKISTGIKNNGKRILLGDFNATCGFFGRRRVR